MNYSNEEEDYRIFYGDQAAGYDHDNAGEQSQEDADAEAIHAGSKYNYAARKRAGLAAPQPLWPGSEDQDAAGNQRAAVRPSNPFLEQLDGIMHQIDHDDAPPQQDFALQGHPPCAAPPPAGHRPQQNFRPRSGVTVNPHRAPSNLNPVHHGNHAAPPAMQMPTGAAAFGVDEELVEAYHGRQQVVAAARVSPRKQHASKVPSHLRRATTNAAIAAAAVTPLRNLRQGGQHTPAAPAGATTTPVINPGNPMLALTSTGARRTGPRASRRPLANILSSTPGSGPARGRACRDPTRLRQPELGTPAGGAALGGGDFCFPAAGAGAATFQDGPATANDAIASDSDGEGHHFTGMGGGGGGGGRQGTPVPRGAAGSGLAQSAPPSEQAKMIMRLSSPPSSPKTRKRGGGKVTTQLRGALAANEAAMANPDPCTSLIVTLQEEKEVESRVHKWRVVAPDGRIMCAFFKQERLPANADMRAGTRLKLTPAPRIVDAPAEVKYILPFGSNIEELPHEAPQCA